MVEGSEGWNKELYDKLSFEYLIACGKNNKIVEWNLAYEAYLKSEWKRTFQDEGYDPENIKRLIDEDSGFVRPDFSGRDFKNANLHGAYFLGAHLEDANFVDAHLKGSQFIQVAVNGGTHFNYNPIDGKTNFTGTSLSSARIFPELRTQLERNIRQIRWEEWYKDNKLLAIPAKIFWKISDYGSSTLSIIFTFLFSNVLFMMFYLVLRNADLLHGYILSPGNDLLLAYMQTTLVPFGILGIDLTTLSLLPVFIIFLQVIFGYTILAALVTRMAIMFQNLSP
ncbi:pentapeptide repeat-containing protein [uncultured Methanocorpusculum sp.]|nr:pentapeptide repeat-containing protein [uncultured Methanocorpusculum sp.]